MTKERAIGILTDFLEAQKRIWPKVDPHIFIDKIKVYYETKHILKMPLGSEPYLIDKENGKIYLTVMPTLRRILKLRLSIKEYRQLSKFYTIIQLVMKNSFPALLAILVLFGCNESEDLDGEGPFQPLWPPTYSITPDLLDYSIVKILELESDEGVGNWVRAAGYIKNYNMLERGRDESYVLAFLAMKNLTLTYDESRDKWKAATRITEHPYLSSSRNDSIVYELSVEEDSLEWEIYWIGSGGEAYLNLAGTCSIHYTVGHWDIYDFNGDLLYEIEWSKSEVANHPNLVVYAPVDEYRYEFTVTPGETWDRQLIVSDLSIGMNNLLDDEHEFYWNGKDKSGAAKSRWAYFGDSSQRCWNEEFMDLNCQN